MEEKDLITLEKIFNKFNSRYIEVERINEMALNVRFKQNDILDTDVYVMIFDFDVMSSYSIGAFALKYDNKADEDAAIDLLTQINTELCETVSGCNMYSIDVDENHENTILVQTFPFKHSNIELTVDEVYRTCLNIGSIVSSFFRTLSYRELNNCEDIALNLYQPRTDTSGGIDLTQYTKKMHSGASEDETEQLYGSTTEYLDYCEEINSFDEFASMGREFKDLHIKTAPFMGNPSSKPNIECELETIYINATRVFYYGRQSTICNLTEGDRLYLLPPPNQSNKTITIVTKDRKEVGVVGEQHTLKILNNISKGYKYFLTVDSFNYFTAGTGVKIKMECFEVIDDIADNDDIVRDDLISLFKNHNCFEKLETFDGGYAIKLSVPISITGRNISNSNGYNILISKNTSSPVYKVIAPLPNLKASSNLIIEDIASKIFSKKKYLTAPVPGSNNMGINFIYNIDDIVQGKEIDNIFEIVKDVTYLAYRFIEALKGNNTERTNSNASSQSGGCYIATCVYGSYDCPQVWTLRRYRDNTLAKTWYGKAFIRTYYAISPTLVKWFGHTNWFKKLWVGTLNKMVKSLQANGVESTPYEDKKW